MVSCILCVEVLVCWLSAFFDDHPATQAYFVPAWEGGHPDHDLLHAVAVQLLASARNRLEIVRQYPLYHGYRCYGPLFRVLSPLPENGPVERQVVGWRDRLRYVRLCLCLSLAVADLGRALSFSMLALSMRLCTQ